MSVMEILEGSFSPIPVQAYNANAMNNRVRGMMNILCWVLIALLAVATLSWTVWASHQPRPHSIWGEPPEKPLN